MFQWIRRSFIAGFFVTVPLVISVAAFIWIFRLIDGFVGPFYTEWLKTRLGREDPVPGLGILTTALLVMLVGAIATNVIGKRFLQRTEFYLLKVPVFRTIYAPVKQLVVAFSPDNEYGFKRVVMVEDRARGFVLGFLTRDTVKMIYVHGATQPALVSPDAWESDIAFLARPNAARLHLDLFYDYRTNVPLYPKWQRFLRERQPRTIIFWGQDDIFFTREGGEAYLTDLPSAEMHRLEAGHFATEDHLDYIATNIRRFYDENVAA